MKYYQSRFFRCLPFLILLPYLVGFTPTDTSFTDITFGAGVGSYVHHDCSGSENRPFYDGGVNVTAKVDGPFRVGITLGGFADFKENGSGAPMLYPELALDFNTFALGTAGIRIGDINKTYFQAGIFNAAPLITGKGALNAGIGWDPGEPFSRMWVGANVFPYNNYGIVIQPEFPLSENNFLFITGRFGSYEKQDEWGASVGMRIRK